MEYKISENNFDLIRLFAASQVAILHVLLSFSPSYNGTLFVQLLELFPGVPIFFFISGFLISRSYEKTGPIGDYIRNRCLRIFPALHVCVFLNIVIVAATGYFLAKGVNLFDLLILYIAKTTIFQFYNPEFMRQFGDGVLNGSLWTICVELQFYFLTPIIYKLFIKNSKFNANIAIACLILISLICNRLLYATLPDHSGSNLWKLARVSFFPWLYMFLCGALVQINFAFLSKYLRKNIVWLVLPGYMIFAYSLREFGFAMGNGVGPIIFFPLVATVFITAFSAPSMARKLLAGNDISYGIYIYHVPIMNMLLFYGYREHILYTVSTLVITIICSLASWYAIERPSLSKKRRATHPLNAAGETSK